MQKKAIRCRGYLILVLSQAGDSTPEELATATHVQKKAVEAEKEEKKWS